SARQIQREQFDPNAVRAIRCELLYANTQIVFVRINVAHKHTEDADIRVVRQVALAGCLIARLPRRAVGAMPKISDKLVAYIYSVTKVLYLLIEPGAPVHR